MADYVDRRLRYFHGEFLQAQDFIDEQRYHMSRQELHNQLLHTPGVAHQDHLKVAKKGDDQVVVATGVAFDGEGRQIVLNEARTLSLEGLADGQWLVVIAYREVSSDPSSSDETKMTRWHEKPEARLVKEKPDDSLELAEVVVTDGVVQSLSDSREFAGVQLSGDVELGNLTVTETAEVAELKLDTGVAVTDISNDLASGEASSLPTQYAVKEYVDMLLVGAVMAFAMDKPPNGWLECDGSAQNPEEYPRLFEKIGTTFGGDGTTAFHVPDLRGEFVRGWDHVRKLGSKEADALQKHTHDHSHTHDYWDIFFCEDPDIHKDVSKKDVPYRFGSNGYDYDNAGYQIKRESEVPDEDVIATTDPKDAKDGSAGSVRAGSETRPRNVSLMYCIKY